MLGRCSMIVSERQSATKKLLLVSHTVVSQDDTTLKMVMMSVKRVARTRLSARLGGGVLMGSCIGLQVTTKSMEYQSKLDTYKLVLFSLLE